MTINNPKYIIIHCTDVSEKTLWDQFDSVNKYHKGLGFTRSNSGLYVGYHRLITGGKNYKCKEDNEEGCHTNQSENGISINFQSLGICIGFDGDIEYPSAVHTQLVKEQVKAWQEQHNIPNMYVKFHREFNQYKTCPGGLIRQGWLDEILTPLEPTYKPASQQTKQEALINIQAQLNIAQRAILKLQELFNSLFKKT